MISIDGVTFTDDMKKVIKVDYKIEKLELPESVEELEEELCYGHDNLKEVIIPSNVREIPRSCFAECHALQNVLFSEDSILNEIDSFAFIGCINLKDISLPTSTSVIGYSSFARCKNLEYFLITESVNRLNARAFEGCENLEDICWLNDKCTHIGDYCFKDCKSLTSFVITESIESIGIGSFEGCISLNDFDCYSPYFKYSAGCLYSLDKFQNNKKTLKHKLFDSEILYLPDDVELETSAFAGNLRIEKVIVPETIQSIPARAFYECKNIRAIDLSDNLKQIGNEAFCYCEGLESIRIPKSVETIGDEAFMFCKNLKSLIVPGNIKNIAYHVFASCDIRKLVIKEGVETIGGAAFGWNKHLRKVCLPKSLKQIDYHAFLYCSMLEEIIIRENCKTIAQDAFELCNNLQRIVIPQGSMSYYERLIPNLSHLLIENPDEKLIETDLVTINCLKKKRLSRYEDLFCKQTTDCPHRNSIQKVIVPEGVESLGSTLFKDCTSLVEVELPDTLQTIGEETFANCLSLKTIKMPNRMKRIGKYAFRGCVDLESITIPEGIKGFPKYSCPFEGCSSLNHVIFPTTFSVWKENIFRGCRNISSVTSSWCAVNEGVIYTKDFKTLLSYTSDSKHFIVPEGVTTIGEDAFRDTEIEEISFPTTLITIKRFAFEGCRKLSKVNFSNGLKRIEDYSFDGCSDLKTLIIPEGVTFIGEHAISIARPATIHVPQSLKIWKDSLQGGPANIVTTYFVPENKIDYYQKFIAEHVHVRADEFIVKSKDSEPLDAAKISLKSATII